LRGLIHFNLKTFIWSWIQSTLYVGSELRILFNREGITGKVCGFQCKAVDKCPLPALQTLAWEPIHQVEIDVGESCGSGPSDRLDSLIDSAGPSKSSQVAILHRFCTETHTGDAGLKQLREILLGNRGGMGFNGDFTVGGKGKMHANLSEDCGQLSRGKDCRCAAPEINGLDVTAYGCVLLRRQADLMPEGTDKGLCSVFTMDFKIEGTKVASLPTERDVEV
jgi:hypothetical protein